MGISRARARRHIEEECERLNRYSSIRNWPKYLFHTAQLEVVARVLCAGQLQPRGQQSEILHDVANPGAVANNPGAHQYSRMYFRPKNGFHMRTEGIKCIGDPYRLDRHMSIPITLILSAERVLTQPDVGFTAGNLATSYTTPGFDENDFDDIPFRYVYHDHAPPRDQMSTIHYHRMAEVVKKGALTLQESLVRVVTRTRLDRTSLLYALGKERGNFEDIIVSEQITGSIFMHRGLYIKELEYYGGSIFMRLNSPSEKPKSKKFKVRIVQIFDKTVQYDSTGYVNDTATKIKSKVPDDTDDAFWEVWLEDVIAFRGRVPHGKSLVF